MSKLVLIDGNSIMNRAFYGIMGTNMLMTEDRNLYKCGLWFFIYNVQNFGQHRTRVYGSSI